MRADAFERMRERQTPADYHTSAPALARARRFFEDNPDEVLTREDVAIKFECGPEAVKYVVRALIQDGVPRAQLPRNKQVRRPRAAKPAKPFPECLTPGERLAIEAVHSHGTFLMAAKARNVSRYTIDDQLKDARRKAGVNSTSDLLARYFDADRERAA